MLNSSDIANGTTKSYLYLYQINCNEASTHIHAMLSTEQLPTHTLSLLPGLHESPTQFLFPGPTYSLSYRWTSLARSSTMAVSMSRPPREGRVWEARVW